MRDRLDKLLLFDQFHKLVDLDGHYALDEKYQVHESDEKGAVE